MLTLSSRPRDRLSDPNDGICQTVSNGGAIDLGDLKLMVTCRGHKRSSHRVGWVKRQAQSSPLPQRTVRPY